MAEWPDELHINDDFTEASHLVRSGIPFLFITGRAGTGKSTLIQCLRQMTDKNHAVVAPTGVAALNAGGQTIHSFFHFSRGAIDLSRLRRLARRKLYQKLDILFIDEISMVRADLLDAMDTFLRLNGPYRDRPFGGVQIVAVGDLHQLPPVVANTEEAKLFGDRYETEYFFSAECLRYSGLTTVELQRIYRQEDENFVRLLGRIRESEDIEEALEQINRLCFRGGAPDSAITLASTNMIADIMNRQKMAALPGTAKIYQGLTEGQFSVDKNLPSPYELVLKAGARVMFTKNDGDHRWVNGTLGTVKDLDKDHVIVEIDESESGSLVPVERMTWESMRYAYDDRERRVRTEPVGSYTQFPLMPAWAVTIHKSQGKTLDQVIIDLGSSAFAHGQVYVALSRCRKLENIWLKRPLKPTDIRFDPRIRNYHQRAPSFDRDPQLLFSED